MKQSQLFTKTRREAPKDEVAKNARLLIRAGFIHKEMAGVYSFLPLGLRVLNKINDIVREHMNGLGGQEVFMSALQEKGLWETTNRWDEGKIDSWFKTTLREGSMLGLGFTHEEPLTALMKNHIFSYRDLPQAVYQIQTKFRNEERAKSGLLRTREFLMKDLYSFSKNDEEHAKFYERAQKAYIDIFKTVGLGEHTYLTYASGGVFSKYSHEFQTVCDAGEDTIYICPECSVAVNEEIIEKQAVCPQCGKKEMHEESAVEVGNIFNLGTRFSDALGLFYKDENEKEQPVVMGSYGIGPGRLMGTVVEVLSDEKGIVWPKTLAPFDVHIVVIAPEEGKGVRTEAEKIYTYLADEGLEVLYDDREHAGAGEKLADADLIGIPWRVVVSEKTLAQKSIELKKRGEEDVRLVKKGEVVKMLK